MAILVEDGTGVENANSFVTLAWADDYHEARNNAKWMASTTTDEMKESALIYATEWINGLPYRWYGSVISQNANLLVWPRLGASGKNGEIFVGVPEQLKRATAELALAHLTKALNEVLARGGDISSVWVGPITVSYQPFAKAGRAFPMVMAQLSRLHYGGYSQIQHRAVRG